MNLPEFIFNSNTLIGIGTVAFAVSYIVRNFVLGNKQAEDKADKVADLSREATQALADTYAKQLQLEREERAKLQLQINEMRGQVGKLQGQLDIYKQIVDNRSPELEKTLKTLLEATNEILAFVKEFREGKVTNTSVVVKETTVK